MRTPEWRASALFTFPRDPSDGGAWQAQLLRYPKLELHMICYNYGTDEHPAVQEWLAHPRFDLHFTPTSP